MTSEQLQIALTSALADRQLLTHPYYQRWVEGKLQLSDLATYAEQYRHFEAALPTMLKTLHEELPAGSAAELVQRNLDDEMGNPKPHVELFADFASGVGAAPTAEPTEATKNLLATYDRLIAEDPKLGLAAVTAYEMQAPVIADSKAEGLRERYELDNTTTAFWDVHATMDEDHARWAIDALAELGGDTEKVVTAARESATAWWEFLDEREAEIAVPV